MSALGGLVVKLALDYAEYTQGLDRSSQEALKFAKNAQGTFDQASRSSKEFLTGVAGNVAGVVTSVIGLNAAFTGVRESINVLESLDDAAQKTGSSVEDLSRIAKVAKNFGDAFEPIEQGITKLAKGLAQIDNPSSDAIRALDAIGVSARDSNGQLRTAADVYIDVAKSLQQYRDGAEKTAVATALFGKNGAELLPMLNNLSQGIDDVKATSAKSTQQAAMFNDAVAKSKATVNGLFMSMAVELLPTLNNIAGAVNKSTGQIGGFSIASESAKIVLKSLAIAAYTVVDTFQGMGREIGARAAQIAALSRMDFNGAKFIGQALAEDNAKSRAAYDKFVDTVWNGEKKISAAVDVGEKKLINYQLQIPSAVDSATKSIEKQAKAFDMELYKLKEYDKEASRARDITQSVATKQEIYNQTLDELNRLKPYLSVETYNRALEKAQKALDDTGVKNRAVVNEMDQLWMQAGRNIQSTLANSIFDFFNGGLDDMWRNAKMAVGRILSEFAALKLAQSVGLTAMFAVPGAASAAGGGGGGFNLNSALSLGSMGTNALSMFKSGFGATSLLSSAGSYLPGSVGSFFSGMAMPASQTAAASFASGAWGASGVSSAAGMGASFASIAGPAIALAAVDAIGRMLAGDKKLGGAEYIPIIGGFLAAMFGRGPYKFRQQSLEGTVTAGGFDGTMTDVYRSKGGWFMGNKHKSIQTPLSAEMNAFFDTQISGYSKSIHEFSKNLGFSTEFIDTYNKEIQIKSEKKKKLTEEAIAEMLDGIGNEFASGVLPIVETLKKAGEDSFDTLSRLNTEYLTLVDASAVILGKTLADSRAMIGGASFEGRTSFIDAAGGVESLAGFAQFFAQNFLTAEEQLRPKVDKLTEQLTGLGLSADLSVDQYKKLIQSFGDVNVVSDSLWLSLKELGPAFLEVRNAQEALAASSLELAKKANMDKIADLLQDRQRRSDEIAAAAIKAQTEVDTAFAALQRAVEGQRKSLSDDYNDSLKAVKISIADVTGQVGKLKNLSGLLGSALDSMRTVSFNEASMQMQAAIESAGAGNFVDAENIQSAVDRLTKINESDFGTRLDFQRAQARSANQLGELNKLTGKELTLQERTLAALNDRALRLEEEFNLANKQLDQVLSDSKIQIDVLRGIDTSVLSVASAIDALQIKMQTAAVLSGNVATYPAQQKTTASYVSDVDIRTFFATPKTPEEIALAALENNVSSTRIADVMGFSPAQVDAFFKDNPLIPKFASGTSYVPRTGPAIVHQGERIINPEQNQDLIRLLEQLVQKIADGNADTAELLRVLKSMRVETNDGIAIRNQVAA